MVQSLLIKFSENQGVWACAVVNEKESISLKNRLQCHVVVLLAYLSCRESMSPSDLLDNFYLVISFKGSC